MSSHAARYGIALRVEPYIFEFLNAKSGSTLVNHGNGRDARATAATFQTPTAQTIWTWWDDMVKDKLALNTGGATNNIDHMLAVGKGDAAMTMEASGVLGTVKQVLESGQYKNVQIDTAPLPSINGGGGVPAGDGSLWISKSASPEKRAAAWQFIKYLASPQLQASLAVAGGFAPIRTDATTVPALQQKWAAEPYFKVGYDQLTTGEENASTAGSLIGDYQGVRDAVKDGMLSMLTGGLSPDAGARQSPERGRRRDQRLQRARRRWLIGRAHNVERPVRSGPPALPGPGRPPYGGDMSSYGLEILSPEECNRLLQTQTVGRVGVGGARPGVFPVLFAVLDGDVVFRTAPGEKLIAAALNRELVFEVDDFDVDSRSGWSVNVLGAAEEIEEPAELARAVALGLEPWAGEVRDRYVRIHASEVTGRRIRPTA